MASKKKNKLPKHRRGYIRKVHGPDKSSDSYYMANDFDDDLNDTWASAVMSDIACNYMHGVHTIVIPVVTNLGPSADAPTNYARMRHYVEEILDCDSFMMETRFVDGERHKQFPMRIVYENRVMYVNITDAMDGKYRLLFSDMSTSSLDVCTMALTVLSYGNMTAVAPGRIITKSHPSTEELAKFDKCSGTLTPKELAVIGEAIAAHRRNVNSGRNSEPKIPASYTYGEMKAFEKLITTGYTYNALTIDLIPPNEPMKFTSDDFEVNSSVGLVMIPHEDKVNAPEVRLNRANFKYIQEYMTEHFFGGTGEEAIPINATELLASPRYGNTFRIRLFAGREFLDCAAKFYLDPNFEQLIVVLDTTSKDDEAGECHPSATVAFENPRQFSFDHVKFIYSAASCGGIGTMPSDYGEWTANVSNILKDPEKLKKAVKDFLNMVFMIQYRPQLIFASAGRNRSKNAVPPRFKEEKSYAVAHIIKRIYLRKDNGEPVEEGRRIDHRDYVTPAWPKKGYWKTMKKSGKQVYVPPTTCQRRLPMTTKPIHIHM